MSDVLKGVEWAAEAAEKEAEVEKKKGSKSKYKVRYFKHGKANFQGFDC
jgi:hypothetical protein